MTVLAQILTLIGSAACYVPLLLIIYWCVSPAFGGRFAVMLSLSGGVNELVKMVTHAPRPYWTDPALRTVEPISSFGMPSGHAQNAVVVWGRIAREYGRPIGWALAGVTAFAIGWARYELHVHSMEQVLAGWAIGLILLAGFIVLERPVVDWWREWTLGGQLIISLVFPLVLLGLVWGSTWFLGDWRVPGQWTDAVQRAGGRAPHVSLSNAAMVTGLLAGILAGLSLMADRNGFSAKGSTAQRLVRIPVGLAGFLLLTGPGMLLGSSPAAKFVLFALAGLWATYGAPLAFIRMGIAYAGSPGRVKALASESP